MFFKILLLTIFIGYLALIGILISRRLFGRRRAQLTPAPHSKPDHISSETPFLELQDVYKSFDNHPVLKGIDLRIDRGETLGILGQSGSGKSVLLKLAVGFLTPEQGRILFKGKDITSMNEAELLEVRRRVSYVFQGSAYFDFLNVRENIAYPLRERGIVDEEVIRYQVDRLLEEVEMEGLGDLQYTELSLGSKKQVAIARAIANNPEAILYDEPTTGVDPIVGKSLSSLIRRLNERESLTSIVVTHDLKCIEMVSDRIVLLKDGSIHFEGLQPDFHSSRDPFVQAFIAGKRFEEPRERPSDSHSQSTRVQPQK